MGHQIRTSEHTSEIGLQEIRPRKSPLSRRNRDEQIRKGAQPYLSGNKQKRHAINTGPQQSNNKYKICLVVMIANIDHKTIRCKTKRDQATALNVLIEQNELQQKNELIEQG